MTVLATISLVKRYGTTEALAGIDLEVPCGAVFGLVGPNGSGKTTAIEIIAGLRRPTAGSVELAVPQDRVAYCPDVAEFEPWLSAIEVLDVAAGLLGRPQPRTALSEMLDRVGLSESAGRRVGGFSRGMRSRLGIAVGLIGEPEVLMADEPAAALDPAGRVEVIDLLAALAGSITVLVSSHDLAEVQRICDHVGILAKGRLVYQGATVNLLATASSCLEVVVRPPAESLHAALIGAGWVRSVSEESPGRFRVDVSDPDAAERELPRVLADCGSRLVKVAPFELSLQDAFFQMTASGPPQL